MWYQNVQNFIPIIPQAESSEAVPNINEIWRPPLRSQGDGQGCRSAICRGEGLLKDSDKLYTYVQCTVPSVASESLSNAPRSICLLLAPDLVTPSQGNPLPPPSPPPRRQTLIVDGEGEWGVGVCGGGGLAPTFTHKILRKREY